MDYMWGRPFSSASPDSQDVVKFREPVMQSNLGHDQTVLHGYLKDIPGWVQPWQGAGEGILPPVAGVRRTSDQLGGRNILGVFTHKLT